MKEFRLEQLIGSSALQLPYNAAFPTGADQPHFFASPLWHDRLALEPEKVLARLHSPVLVLVGVEDMDTPADDYVAVVRRGLAGAATAEASVCLLQERTRHFFSAETVRMVATWFEQDRLPPGNIPEPCQRISSRR
jgi:hypothetical protein